MNAERAEKDAESRREEKNRATIAALRPSAPLRALRLFLPSLLGCGRNQSCVLCNANVENVVFSQRFFASTLLSCSFQENSVLFTCTRTRTRRDGSSAESAASKLNVMHATANFIHYPLVHSRLRLRVRIANVEVAHDIIVELVGHQSGAMLSIRPDDGLLPAGEKGVVSLADELELEFDARPG